MDSEKNNDKNDITKLLSLMKKTEQQTIKEEIKKEIDLSNLDLLNSIQIEELLKIALNKGFTKPKDREEIKVLLKKYLSFYKAKSLKSILSLMHQKNKTILLNHFLKNNCDFIGLKVVIDLKKSFIESYIKEVVINDFGKIDLTQHKKDLIKQQFQKRNFIKNDISNKNIENFYLNMWNKQEEKKLLNEFPKTFNLLGINDNKIKVTRHRQKNNSHFLVMLYLK
jgi:hypothetical protein